MRKKYLKKNRYITNFGIKEQNLRVIDEEGKFLGILSRNDALRKAQDNDKDLVLIAPRANPPVAKIIDFKKFLYQEEKKRKKAKKGIKKGGTKDIKLALFMAEQDKNRFIEKAKKFLKEGYQVRLNLALKGREITKKKMALDFIKEFINKTGEVNVSKEPRVEGRVVRAVINFSNKPKKNEEKTKNKKISS